MTPFQQADIQVESIESKQASTGNWKYIITDNNRKKYYFYEKVKGEAGDVFCNFKTLEVKKGDIIHISYTEEEKSFEDPIKKNLVKYTDRFIASLREAGATPQLQTPPTPQKQPEGRNWDKEAYAKCCSIWAAQDIINSGVEGAIQNVENNWYWKLFTVIQQDSEKRFSPLAQAALKANPDFFQAKPVETPKPLTDEVIAEKVAAGEPAFEEVPEGMEISSIPF